MPQLSKYSTEQIEAIMTDMIAVLEKHQAKRDLSLMVLGNMLTSVFENQFSAKDRQPMAQEFTRVLLKSLANKKD